jgi:hypothetical protein
MCMAFAVHATGHRVPTLQFDSSGRLRPSLGRPAREHESRHSESRAEIENFWRQRPTRSWYSTNMELTESEAKEFCPQYKRSGRSTRANLPSIGFSVRRTKELNVEHIRIAIQSENTAARWTANCAVARLGVADDGKLYSVDDFPGAIDHLRKRLAAPRQRNRERDAAHYPKCTSGNPKHQAHIMVGGGMLELNRSDTRIVNPRSVSMPLNQMTFSLTLL